MKKAVFAGTFDPVTKGHLSVIEKASNLFNEVIVAICINPKKHTLFTVEDRLKMLKAVCKRFKNVKVVYHNGLTVDLMKEENAKYLVRGIRNDTDYEYENQMQLYNKSLYPELITIFFPCDEELLDVSSTQVRKGIKEGKDISEYLPKEVVKLIVKK